MKKYSSFLNTSIDGKILVCVIFVIIKENELIQSVEELYILCMQRCIRFSVIIY